MKKFLVLSLLTLFILCGCKDKYKDSSATEKNLEKLDGPRISCKLSSNDSNSEEKSTTYIGYYFNKDGDQLKKITISMELLGNFKGEEATERLRFMKNSLCTLEDHDNVSCTTNISDTGIKVVSEEIIEDNKSLLLNIKVSDDFTYDSVKEQYDKVDGILCIYE